MQNPINAQQAVVSTPTTKYVYGGKSYDDEGDQYGFMSGSKTTPVAGYTTIPYVAAAPCHTGNVKLFEYKQDKATLVFFAGGTSRGSWQKPGQVLIALQGHDKGDVTPVKVTGMLMPELTKYDSRVINLDVVDQQAPKLPAKFWLDLLDGLVRIAKGEPSKTLEVLVRCMGGHGRTGCVVAVLAWLCGATGEEEPVAWLRKAYCKEAVESNAQFNYIELMTGQKSLETAHPFVYTTPKAVVTTELPALPSVSTNQSDATKSAAVPSTTPQNSGSATKETEADRIWAKYQILYLPFWPTSVAWSDERNGWVYNYHNGIQRVSQLYPLINGVDIGDVVDDKRFDIVDYVLGAVVLTFPDGTKMTLQEEAPDEMSLESVIYLEKANCWSYRMLGATYPLLLRVDPLVFGTQLTNGKWIGVGGPNFVTEIYYVDEGEIEVSLLNGTTVSIEMDKDGELKTTVSPTVESYPGCRDEV